MSTSAVRAAKPRDGSERAVRDEGGAAGPEVSADRTPPALFTFPNRIFFGEGARALLAREINQLGMKRPLVVADPGVVKAGLVEAVTQGLGGFVVFSDVQANPTESDVLAGLERYREQGCDGLIAVGGGSPIDAAKAIRLLTTHPGRLADYDVMAGGMETIRATMPPLAAIPTTAGTGSEAGRGTLIQIPANRRKTAVLSPHLLPSVAICDPELTHGLSPELTAGTGMDAFSHCVESYFSTTFHPICDGIAVEGLRYISRGLETSVRDGANREARSSMMMGSLLGGISFHKGLGVIHSLSHALGSEGRAHHGVLNAILLPHALRFNRDVAAARMADLGSRLGLGRGGDAAGHLITLVELVLARLPLPRRLGLVPGLDKGTIPEYARLALLDHCHRTNPRPCSQPDLENLLEKAW